MFRGLPRIIEENINYFIVSPLRLRGSNHLVCAVCAHSTMLIIRFEMSLMYYYFSN